MSKLTGKTWIPLGAAAAALLAFGGASFQIGGFYQRAVTTESDVQTMKGDIAQIKRDITVIKGQLVKDSAPSAANIPAFPRWERASR